MKKVLRQSLVLALGVALVSSAAYAKKSDSGYGSYSKTSNWSDVMSFDNPAAADRSNGLNASAAATTVVLNSSKFDNGASCTANSWVTADEVYGQAEPLRAYLEHGKISYVMAVRRTEKVTMHTGPSTAEVVIAGPETQWQRMSAGEGTKGPRVADWSSTQLTDDSHTEGHRYILARRSIDDTTDLAYYFCCSNKPINLEELVHVAASRWTVEECFQTAKNEAGLDHYQVRDYTAWYKHMTLSMIALAFLTIIKTVEEKRGSSTRTTVSSRSPATKYDDYSTGSSGP